MVESCVVGWRTNYQSAVTEHIAQDIAVMGLRYVVEHHILHPCLARCARYYLCHPFGVAIHRAVADDQSLFRLIAAQTVVNVHHLIYIVVPYGSVGGADIVELHTFQLLQRILHGRAILADDIRIIAHHLEPEAVAVDLRVDDSSVERTETAECVAGEEHVRRRFERHHRLRPVHHRREHKVQRVRPKLDGIAVFHLYPILFNAIKPLYHAEGFLVADNLYFRIIFLQQCQRTAVVGLHVVDDEVVDFPVAYHFADILDELGEKVHFHRINQAHLFVVDQIRVVAHAVRQRPQSLEQVLVAVVHTDVVDFVCNFSHGYIQYMISFFRLQS